MRVRRLFKYKKSFYEKYKGRAYLKNVYDFLPTKHQYMEKGRTIYKKRRDIDEKDNEFWDYVGEPYDEPIDNFF